jgi:hypothetical protein
MVRVLFDFVVNVIKPTWRRHFRLPLLRQAQGYLASRPYKTARMGTWKWTEDRIKDSTAATAITDLSHTS